MKRPIRLIMMSLFEYAIRCYIDGAITGLVAVQPVFARN